ncbi:DUF6191 domain-containing protein [Kitasatospora sp. NPDC053057]|uniref:DUF6191 domain-containing protein n=1 Tax=Kitasatospora sp. NPDC053057 TaxID=3364062 RepID=UPI0037CAFB99
MGFVVGGVCVVAVAVGLMVLAGLQVRGESSPRRRQGGPGVGVGGPGGLLDELHAMFSPGKRIQVEQRREQLARRDDAEAGAPPHFGVDLDRGVAVLRLAKDDGGGDGRKGGGEAGR